MLQTQFMDKIIEMTPPSFSEYIYKKFVEWEETKKTPRKKRMSFSAFARWLSDNTLKKKVNQQAVDSWLNGAVPKDEKYILVLSEKLGDEVYEVLGKEKPNENVVYVQTQIENLNADEIKKIRDQVEKYIVNKKEK